MIAKLFRKKGQADHRCVAVESGERCPYKAIRPVVVHSPTSTMVIRLCAWHGTVLRYALREDPLEL